MLGMTKNQYIEEYFDALKENVKIFLTDNSYNKNLFTVDVDRDSNGDPDLLQMFCNDVFVQGGYTGCLAAEYVYEQQEVTYTINFSDDDGYVRCEDLAYETVKLKLSH